MAGLCVSGCEMPAAHEQAIPGEIQDFTVQRVRISPLSDFVASRQNAAQTQIKTYVELLDRYDSPLKKPGVFRFELYEYVPMVVNPRGKRLVIWPDIDLTGPAENNQHWKEFVRSYEFYLPLGFSPRPNQNYLLEATCLTGGQRFSGVIRIRYQP